MSKMSLREMSKASLRELKEAQKFRLPDLEKSPVPVLAGMFRPHITTGDGTELSVQASQYHYCEPRWNGADYTRVEVGFPSTTVPFSWRDYIDGPRFGFFKWLGMVFGLVPDETTETVYAYIPVEKVTWFIGRHGGIAFLGKED